MESVETQYPPYRLGVLGDPEADEVSSEEKASRNKAEPGLVTHTYISNKCCIHVNVHASHR